MNNNSFAFKNHIIKWKDSYLLSAKIFLGICLLSFIFISVEPDRIILAAKNINVFYFSAALLLLIPNIYLQFRKWEITCNHLLFVKQKRKIIYSLFYGLSGGAFTPARLGEYGGRGLALKDIPFVKVSIATFIEKMFVLIVEIMFGIIAFAAFILLKLTDIKVVGVPSILGVILLIVLGIIIYLHMKKIILYLEKIFSKLSYFKNNPEVLKSIFTLDKKYFSKMLFVTVLFYLCYVFQFVFITAALTHSPDFINYFWAAVLIMFSKTILGYFSFGELGIREGSAIFFLSQFGYNSSLGFNAGIFIFLINIILPALAGLSLIFIRNNDE